MKAAFGAALAAFLLASTVVPAFAAPPAMALRPAGAAPSAGAAAIVGPDVLFEQGLFDQAREGYAAVPKTSPQYENALRQLGAIALLQNHLPEAEAMLRNALARDPADKRGVGLLAETVHREGRFADLAQLLRQMGRTDRAAEFELFGKAQPYRIANPAATTTIEFLETEPVALLRAKVNGVDGLFIIDTGASEIILDPQFAHDAHVQMTAQGAAAGGKTAPLTFGRIGQFGLGTLETDDVPAMMLSTRGFSASARGKRVAGVLGTEFLSQFRATIDYPRDRLVLEPRDAPVRAGTGAAEIPIWLMGDHFILAPGRLDKGPKQLFFVDTGVASYAFAAPDSTLRDAGVAVPTPQGPAANAVGQAPSAPFPVAQLSVGNLERSNLQGLYGPFPPSLERGLGVHIGGIVSHAFFAPYAITFDFVRMKLTARK